jgi:hypothetical protein
MKKINLILFGTLLFITACKENKSENDATDAGKVTRVLPFIQGQVANIDTSLFALKKIERRDTLNSDTIDIHRNQFRTLAKDFLEIPDLSLKKFEDEYEQSKVYDQDINVISLLTLPKGASSSDIQKQEVIIVPDAQGGKIKTILIDRAWTTKDSSVTKKMIWEVDSYFQVLTLKQMPGQAETSHLLKVTWKDFTK